MASGTPRPLDDAFVARLRGSLGSAAQVSAEAHQHWQGLLNHFAGRSDFEITAYIAQNFNNNVWTGNEPWFSDPVIQQVFAGYDRTAFNGSNPPPLNEEARSHYHPSTALGRGHLFPASPVQHAGAPILNRQQFNALTQAERENYQLTSVFGGYRFQRVPGAPDPSVGGTPGLTASQAPATSVPPFDTSVTDNPVDNNAGSRSPRQGTPAGTNIYGVVTPPSSNRPGTTNVPQPGQPGGASGVPPAPPLPTIASGLPTPGTMLGYQPRPPAGIPPQVPADPAGLLAPGPPIRYPDLINMTYDTALPPNLLNNPFMPVTPGSTTVTGANISGTGGSTSVPVGTTPGTAGSIPPGTSTPSTTGVPSGGKPGDAVQTPAGPGGLPVTPGSAPTGLPVTPGSAPGVTPGGTSGGLPVAPGSAPTGLPVTPGSAPGVTPGSAPTGLPITPSSTSGGLPVPPVSIPGGLPVTPSNIFGGLPVAPSSASTGLPVPPSNTAGGLPVPPVSVPGGLPTTPSNTAGGLPVPPVSVPGGLPTTPSNAAGGLPVTPGSAPGGPVPPPGGPEGLPGGAFPPQTGPGIPPVTPGSTPAGPPRAPGPPGPPMGAPGADGSVPRPLQPSASDMQHPFTWRGQVQPPVGTRLRAAQILLDEGDVDREMHWERNVAEVKEFLDWLLSSDEAPPIGPESRLLANQLLEKVQAHNLFNQFHYGPNTPNKVVTSDMIPARKPRLKYNGKLPLMWGRDHHDREHLLPGEYPTHPRAEMIVNDQWLTDVEKEAGLTEDTRSRRQATLSQDEVELWQLGEDGQPRAGNAALEQERTFEECIARDGIGFQGWVETRRERDGSLSRTLFDGGRLGAGDLCYARERAVRRAGLQAALRQFSSNENTVANTPWRRVRLALSADEVQIMRKNTGAGPARKYELPVPGPHQRERTDGKDDPQGFTANMAKFWADRARDMATAREAVVSHLGFGLPPGSAPAQRGSPPAVLPPVSLWGAHVDSGLGAEDEFHRRMLKAMRTTRKLFERELKIAPRSFLARMDAAYHSGLDGRPAVHTPEGQQQPRDIAFHPERDYAPGGVPRPLDMMEIYWIRFLLTQSITPEMTHELQPRASLFVLFADKLARAFSDLSDPLFPDLTTRVSVEDLLDYIHDRTDGPVTRVRFYAHDVQMWLERLHSQGRCRYQQDWRCYGWVMRPIPTCHPEQLVRWTVPDDAAHLRPRERNEDVVSAPRFDRLRNWHSLIRRCLHNSPLDDRVENYFLGLAYRWGWYMNDLTRPQDGLEASWKQKHPRQVGDMSHAIDAYRAEFDRISQWNCPVNNPLVRLVKATLPDRGNDNALTADASLQLIRDHIIKEAVKKDNMLWPARSANNYLDPLDAKVRPRVWGWARPEVRGRVKRFFSVNRWPVQLQTERRQGIITRDEDVNEDLLWDPRLEDPTPSKYYRPKARPYIDEKVEFRSGHRNFLIGDTPRQKQFVIDRMFAQMGRAMTTNANGGGDIPRPGIRERFQNWSDYLWDRIVDDDDGHGHDHDHNGNDGYEEPGARLRKFDPKDIPRSYDPRPRKRAADDEAAKQAGPKRGRREGSEEQDDAGGGGVEEVPVAPGIPGVAPAVGAAGAGAAGAGAAGAGAADVGAADQGDHEMNWWEHLIGLGAI